MLLSLVSFFLTSALAAESSSRLDPFHLKLYSEWNSPGFTTEQSKVPDGGGRGVNESGLGGFATLTRDLTDNWSLAWMQSYSLDIPWNSAPNDLVIRDPRLGVRYQPDLERVTLKLDAYLQPNFWEKPNGDKRITQFASRVFSFIPFKNSRFSLLFLADMSVTLFREVPLKKDKLIKGFWLGGFSIEILPWLSWDNSATLSYYFKTDKEEDLKEGKPKEGDRFVRSNTSNFQTGLVFKISESIDLGGYLTLPLLSAPNPKNMYVAAQVNANLF